jgi:hypothetical protein
VCRERKRKKSLYVKVDLKALCSSSQRIYISQMFSFLLIIEFQEIQATLLGRFAQPSLCERRRGWGMGNGRGNHGMKDEGRGTKNRGHIR